VEHEDRVHAHHDPAQEGCRSPSDSAVSSAITSAAEAPSLTWDEEPAVTTQRISGWRCAAASSKKAGRSRASASIEVSARMPSSWRMTVPSGRVTGLIWAVRSPASSAAAARRWDRTDQASDSSRLIPQRAAMSSAEMPCRTSPSG